MMAYGRGPRQSMTATSLLFERNRDHDNSLVRHRPITGPGLRRLLERGNEVVVWNRTVEKAREVVGDLSKDIRPYSLEALTAALQPGDLAVSMLPADQHVAIAKACLAKNAHFVSSSYIAPEMRASRASSKPRSLYRSMKWGSIPALTI